MSEKEAKERIEWLAKRQALLEQSVNRVQRVLYERILARIEEVQTDPAVISQLFTEYVNKDYVVAISQMAKDFVAIAGKNAEYFSPIFSNPTDFEAVKSKVDGYLLKRFGLEKVEGNLKVTTGGYFDNLIKDTSVRQTVQETAYKLQSTGAGLQEYVSTLKDLIQGTPDQPTGAVERWFKTNAFDSYMNVDSSLQEQYSTEVGLDAALYLGGIIEGSRDFCRVRNGKVYLKSEIATWGTSKDKEGGYSNKAAGMFNGKPKDYVPQVSRGGYACRHMLNYVSNTVAMSMRDDLEAGPDGKLRVKGLGTQTQEEYINPKIPKPLQGLEIAKDKRFWDTVGNEVELTDFVTDDDSGSWYIHNGESGLMSIDMASKRWVQGSKWRHKAVVQHEYGHGFHYQKNIISEDGVAPDFKKLMSDARKDLMKNIEERYKEISEFKSEAYDAYLFNRDFSKNEKFGNLYASKFKGLSAADLKEQIGVVNDVIGGLTNGEYGGGHSVDYYETNHGGAREVFAHTVSTYFSGNKVLSHFLPDVHKLMIDYFKTVENGTYRKIGQ